MLWKTIKDGRGSTYVMELPTPFKPGAYSGWATHVCRWFNRDERAWVVSYSDESGHQVGSSEYMVDKWDAINEAEGLFTAALPTLPARHPFNLRPGSVSKCDTCGQSRTYGSH